MPKRVVKRLWFQRHQNIEQLASLLQVSPQALRYRLDQLGLTERPLRCVRPAGFQRSAPAFQRATPTRSLMTTQGRQ